MARLKFPATLTFLFVFSFSIAYGQTHWVASWGSAQQVPEPRNALATNDLRDATLRQIVHLSLGGSKLRVIISNRYGSAPLHFAAVHIARPESAASPKLVPGTDTALTFSGRPDVMVPAGADYVSDPVNFSAAPLSDVAVSIYLDQAPEQQTGHPGSRATSYLAHGNQVGAADLPDAKTFEHWYFIAAVDVAAPPDSAAIVTLGDSITDGHGATTNGNNRWPDVLARRLQANVTTKSISVVNEGIGGNRLLLDSLGPNGLARFDQDVLAPSHARYVIVLEGVNDLGMFNRDEAHSAAEHDQMVHSIIGAYEQIIARAHTHGIRAIGATIMPFEGSQFYHPGPEIEADRQKINDWIRTPGHFDALLDFDKLTRDPAHTDRLLAAYDSGDHLHPSPAGYEGMANAIPLTLFEHASQSDSPQIAFTFDDLPSHGPLPAGETRIGIMAKIATALHDAHMPPVYGFVNGLAVEQFPGDIKALENWHAAGNPLGNHTWSHMNLNQNSLQAFEDNTTENEPLLGKLMDSGNWHWFRFPYLAEGDTPEKRAGVRAFLLQHGYKIAGVTMSFGDYMWNEPYARCVAKGDTVSIDLLEKSYLQAADDSIRNYRELSHKLLGRDIPYVLLMHVGAFDARMLPRLLDLYKSRGFQFVTLDQAESDPFYREDTDLSLPPGPDMLEGVASARHTPVARLVPVLDLANICK
ncbi:MAG TPA: GDSL-type esterase/lipase family protein [Terriglobales bacterium]|nr:GDSL-type esterase/lipase family protein [Terriglobales bacterium]